MEETWIGETRREDSREYVCHSMRLCSRWTRRCRRLDVWTTPHDLRPTFPDGIVSGRERMSRAWTLWNSRSWWWWDLEDHACYSTRSEREEEFRWILNGRRCTHLFEGFLEFFRARFNGELLTEDIRHLRTVTISTTWRMKMKTFIDREGEFLPVMRFWSSLKLSEVRSLPKISVGT